MQLNTVWVYDAVLILGGNLSHFAIYFKDKKHHSNNGTSQITSTDTFSDLFLVSMSIYIRMFIY